MELLRQRFIDKGWSQEAFQIAFEAGFKCVYCDCDILDSYGSYLLSDFDHLLPKSKYPELIERRSNKVLACRTCNLLKRAFDPNSDGDQVEIGSRDLTDFERQEFIARSRREIERRRCQKAEWIGELQAAIDAYRARQS